MNREIKFRGKRVNGGEWVYGMTISNGTIKRKINNIFFEVAENKWVGVLPETLGQYTGLKDKNGKEIYEGDIISIGGGGLKAVVIWFKGAFRFRAELNSKAIYFEDIVRDYDVQVVGNVIDNPELIK